DLDIERNNHFLGKNNLRQISNNRYKFYDRINEGELSKESLKLIADSPIKGTILDNSVNLNRVESINIFKPENSILGSIMLKDNLIIRDNGITLNNIE